MEGGGAGRTQKYIIVWMMAWWVFLGYLSLALAGNRKTVKRSSMFWHVLCRNHYHYHVFAYTWAGYPCNALLKCDGWSLVASAHVCGSPAATKRVIFRERNITIWGRKNCEWCYGCLIILLRWARVGVVGTVLIWKLHVKMAQYPQCQYHRLGDPWIIRYS